MKRILLLMSLLAVTLLCYCCSSGAEGKNHPAARIETGIWKALGKGDVDKVDKLMKDNFNSSRSYERAQVIKDANFFSEKIKEYGKGLKKIEVVSVSEEDSEKAVEVLLRLTFGNGDVLYSHEIYYNAGDKWERRSTYLDLVEEAML